MEDLDKAFDKKFSPQIGNNDTCYDCGINCKKILSFIRQREKELLQEILRYQTKSELKDGQMAYFIPTVIIEEKLRELSNEKEPTQKKLMADDLKRFRGIIK